MPTKAEKLLQDMRGSKRGWTRRDLETLYTGFGFEIRNSRGPHDMVVHPVYKQLVTSLPRHRKLAVAYVTLAIKLIEQLQTLQNEQE